MIEGLWQDLRYAVRLLRRTPRNSAIAVAILALGIGANTAMFSAVNYVLLQPLPFPDAGRLLRVRDAVVSADGQLNAFNMRARNLLALREGQDVFDGTVGFAGTDMTLIGRGAPERLSVVLQTDGNARTLDARPALGRDFSPAEERRGLASGVAVISDSFWKSHFGGSPAALGATVQLDARLFTVIGVMPPRYAFPYHAQIWVPMTLDPADTSSEFAVFAHLKPGVTRQQAQGEMDIISLSELDAIAALHPVDVSAIDARLRRNLPLDVRVALAWDTDNTDIVLWVKDPNDEWVSYGHRLSRQGGRNSVDVTQGYGPEVFSLRKAIPGTYEVHAKYYGSHRQALGNGTSVMMRLSTGFGTAAEKHRDVILRLEEAKDDIVVGTFDVK